MKKPFTVAAAVGLFAAAHRAGWGFGQATDEPTLPDTPEPLKQSSSNPGEKD